MKLIFAVKRRVGTGLRSCCCFSHTALNLVGARVYMVKPNNKVANIGSNQDYFNVNMHTGDIVEMCLVYSLIDSGGSQIYLVYSLVGGGGWQRV